MTRPAHKARTRWLNFPGRSASHACQPLRGRHGAQHALRSRRLPAKPSAALATLLTVAALLVAGVFDGLSRGRAPRQSFTPVSSAEAASRSHERLRPQHSWSLSSAGEFNASRAFTLSDAEKIREEVADYKPKAVVDEDGRFQHLGISSHQSEGRGPFENYSYSQCTWWAAVRRSQLGRPVPGNLGNGGEWAHSAAAQHFRVDQRPEVGAVIVFQPGQAGAVPYYGHVAVVEAVLSDGSVIVSECSSNNDGQIQARRIWDASRYQFIH